MAEYPYTMKQIAEITGKSYTALYDFVKKETVFINQHTQITGRFKKYDEEVLQAFIKQFGRVDKQVEADVSQSDTPEGEISPIIAPDSADSGADGEKEGETKQSVIEAFEAQIEALKKERDELSSKLEARERDCAEWRTQAGQALSALSKEQERVERLEERLAGYLPAPNTDSAKDTPETQKPTKRKLTFRERVGVLFGRELDFK